MLFGKHGQFLSAQGISSYMTAIQNVFPPDMCIFSSFLSYRTLCKSSPLPRFPSLLIKSSHQNTPLHIQPPSPHRALFFWRTAFITTRSIKCSSVSLVSPKGCQLHEGRDFLVHHCTYGAQY